MIVSREVIKPGFLERYSQEKQIPDEEEIDIDKEIEQGLREDAQRCLEGLPRKPIYRLAAQIAGAPAPGAKSGKFSGRLVEELSLCVADQIPETAYENADSFLAGRADKLSRKVFRAYGRYEYVCRRYETLLDWASLRGASDSHGDYLRDYMKKRMRLSFLELTFWRRLHRISSDEIQPPHAYEELKTEALSFREEAAAFEALSATPIEGYKQPSFREVFQELEKGERETVRQRLLSRSEPYLQQQTGRPLYGLFCRLHEVEPRPAGTESSEFHARLSSNLNRYFALRGEDRPDPEGNEQLPEYLKEFLISSSEEIDRELVTTHEAYQSSHIASGYFNFLIEDIDDDLQYFASYYEDEAAHAFVCHDLTYLESRFWGILNKYATGRKSDSADFYRDFASLLNKFRVAVYRIENILAVIEPDGRA